MLRLSDEFRNGLGSAAEIFHQAITPNAVSYLLGRGLSREAIAEYKLGTVTGEVSGYSDYEGMVSIPYLTLRGGVCAIKARQPHDCTDACEHSKYLQPAGESRLFNPIALEKADRLGVAGLCEGEFDSMILTSMCGIPTVGIPGTDTWHKHSEWPRIFRGYRRVLYFRDNDPVDPKTGAKAGNVLAKRILRDIESAEVIDLGYKDPTLAYLAIGAAGIRQIAKV